MGNKTIRGVLALAVTSLLGHAADSAAAGAQDERLEDVVVTATRVARPVGEVPLSIAVFDQAKLDQMNVKTVEDVARMTPGLTFARATRGNTQGSNISIRGIASTTGAATVGIYIDETPVQVRPQSLSSSNPYPRVFDLERIEVLRGPQGTLFGAGSQGGTIRFITPEPSLTETSSYVRTEISATEDSDSSYEAGAAIGGPLVDGKLGGRISAWYRRDGGFVDRVSWVDGHVLAKNADSQDAATVRGALKYKPTDRLTITPAVFFQRTSIDDSSIYWEAYSNPDQRKFSNGNPIPAPTRDKVVLPTLKIQYDWDAVSLVSSSSYLARDNRNVYDNTALGLANFGQWPNVAPPPALADVWAKGQLLDRQRAYTQEVRLQNTDPNARVSWLAGLYYQHAEQYSEMFNQRPYLTREILFRTGQPLTVLQFFGVPLYQGVYQLYATSDTVDEDLSAFGNVDFKLTDKLTLTAGVRVGKSQYDNVAFSAGPTVASLGVTSISDQKDKPVLPKLAVSYQAAPGTIVYGSYSEGYRQGSTQGQVSNRCDADLAALGLKADPREIKPDSVTSYEFGAKSTFADGRIFVDASVYRITWTDIQSSLILPNCNIPIVANFGDARSQGLDFAANARFGAATLGLAVGYTDAKFTTTTSGAGGRVIRSKGQPLPTPPWSLAMSMRYDLNAFGKPAYLRGDYQYLAYDDTPLDLASAATDPTVARAPASRNLDLRAGLLFGDVDVSLFVANAMDQSPQFGRYRDTQRSFNYRGVTVRPRTIGVTATMKF